MYVFNNNTLVYMGLAFLKITPCAFECTGMQLFAVYDAPGSYVWPAWFLTVTFILILSRSTFIMVEEICQKGARSLYSSLVSDAVPAK